MAGTNTAVSYSGLTARRPTDQRRAYRPAAGVVPVKVAGTPAFTVSDLAKALIGLSSAG
jgi:hypothetical protein